MQRKDRSDKRDYAIHLYVNRHPPVKAPKARLRQMGSNFPLDNDPILEIGPCCDEKLSTRPHNILWVEKLAHKCLQPMQNDHYHKIPKRPTLDNIPVSKWESRLAGDIEANFSRYYQIGRTLHMHDY